MQIDVGPYRFSETDARRTLAHAGEFLDDFPAAAHVHQSDRRERIAAAIGDLDVGDASVGELRRPLAAVWAQLLAARDDLVAADGLPPTTIGHVVRLSVSDGGVPKRPIDAFEVGYDGVIGDRQASRRHHGAPFQALCLWDAETIDQLAADGHPIGYGDAGENVTISEIDWPVVRPGVRLRLGSVVCEISSHAEPCSKNAQWFSDRDISRIHDRNGPWSRMYATVIVPGSIAVGDHAIVEPDG